MVYLALWSGLCTPTEGARSDILTTPRDLVAKLRKSLVYLLVSASCVTVTFSRGGGGGGGTVSFDVV